jgi:hypothetical protein
MSSHLLNYIVNKFKGSTKKQLSSGTPINSKKLWEYPTMKRASILSTTRENIIKTGKTSIQEDIEVIGLSTLSKRKEYFEIISNYTGFTVEMDSYTQHIYLIDTRTDIRYDLVWEVLKKQENAKEILTTLGKARKLIVDDILKAVIDYIECSPFCKTVSVGSSNWDSDYDISVNGYLSYDVVKYFNEIFYKIFYKSSNLIFDTNIYGTSFIEQNPIQNWDILVENAWFQVKPENIYYTLGMCNLDELGDLTNSDTRYHLQDIIEQLSWAWIRLVEQKDIFSMLIDNSNKTFNKLITDTITIAYLKKIVLSSGDTAIDYIPDMYLKTLGVLEKKRYTITDKKLLREQISLVNYFGEETYLTQGAFNHVVGHLQMKLGALNVTETEYICSLLENIYYFSTHYLRYAEIDCYTVVNGIYIITETHFKSILKVNKYLFRMFDATKNLGYPMKELMELTTKIAKLKNEKQDDAILLQHATVLGNSINNAGGIDNLLKNIIQQVVYPYYIKLYSVVK